jgi:glucan 1,3-beta-glucosidase
MKTPLVSHQVSHAFLPCSLRLSSLAQFTLWSLLQFAVTDCHLRGELCWYPGQLSAPPDAPLCDIDECTPHMFPNVFGQLDYPLDEYTLWTSFANSSNRNDDGDDSIATAWLNHHLENFFTRADLVDLQQAGVTHVRVPLPHWILGHLVGDKTQVWVVGQRWEAFSRLVTWARDLGMQVWPDIHSAPGSQNGFDNSGRQAAHDSIGCSHWSKNATRVEQSLQVLDKVSARMAAEGMQDVVTGFGLLNEPFKDCNRAIYMKYIDQGLEIVRGHMGDETYIYVSDMFVPQDFNDGHWWQDNVTKYQHTFLDTHYYHVFAGNTRAMSPRQHIALTCQNEYHVERRWKDTEGGIASCCYQDPPRNTIPAVTVKRMVGEWSAALDTLPVDKLYSVMLGIAANGTAPEYDRKLTTARKALLLRFVQAQMVVYEAADKGVGGGWFYWTAKMEGGVFAEWDFTRGIREGWIPRVPDPTIASTDLFGTCYDLLWRTNDSMSVIHEYPDPAAATDPWMGVSVDDDIVLTHGQSLLEPSRRRHHRGYHGVWINLGWIFLTSTVLYYAWHTRSLRKKGYTAVPTSVV